MNALFCATLVAAALNVSFDDGKAGKPPAGFEFTSSQKKPAGRWVLAREGKNLVLAQTDKKKERFASAVVKDSSFTAVRLTAKIKTIGGYQGAGLVWGYKDADHYFVARSNPDEGNVRVDKVVGGVRTKLGSKPVDGLETGAWHTLRVEHQGKAISVYLAETKVVEVADAPPAEAGKVGLWIKDDTVARFDDFSAEGLGP